jgi:hypothetical protein
MSYDAGETWTDTGVVVSKNTNYKWAAMCHQSPTNKDVLFAGNFRSGDKGKTWTALDGVDVVCCHNPYNKKELYGYDVSGNIKVSYDDGQTWQQVAKAKMPNGITGGTINDMAYDGINNILYYVSGTSSSRSVYKLTINNGKTTDITNNIVRDGKDAYTTLEAFGPNLRSTQFQIKEIINERGESVDAARHPKEHVYIYSPIKLTKYDMIRLVR